METIRGRAVRSAWIALLLALLAGTVLGLSAAGLGIPCVFQRLTGLDCPGCGITRMGLELLQGDLPSAFRCNPGAFLSLPVLACFLGRLWLGWLKTGKLRCSSGENRFLWLLAMLLLAFGIFRNTPFYPW